MSHTRAWDEINPQDTDVAGYGAQEMRWERQNIRERLALDHNWAETTGTDDTALDFDGLHKKVTLVNTTTVTGGAADKAVLHAFDENAVAEPGYTREDGNVSVLSVPCGTVLPYAGAVLPTGYLVCDGSSVSTTTYATLYSVIGTAFGSAGAGFFNVPDLRDRFPVGAGVSYAVGDYGGEATHALSIAEMPTHAHGLQAIAVDLGTMTAAAQYSTLLVGGYTAVEGGNAAHNNTPLYTGLNYIIKT